MDGHDGKAMDVFVILMILMDLLSMVMCATRFDPLHADGRGQHMEAAKMITGCHFTRAGPLSEIRFSNNFQYYEPPLAINNYQ